MQDGVPRGAYRGIVSLRNQKGYRLFLAPAPGFDPAELSAGLQKGGTGGQGGAERQQQPQQQQGQRQQQQGQQGQQQGQQEGPDRGGAAVQQAAEGDEVLSQAAGQGAEAMSQHDES